MPYLKRINSLPLINHISYKYAQVSDIGPSWSSCFLFPQHFLTLSKLKSTVNSLPIDKFLDWSKLKELADNKVNVNEKLKFVFGRV